MTYDEALDDHEACSIAVARRVLRDHGCHIMATLGGSIEVTNDYDPAEWIDCTPAAILGWLGY